MADLRLQIFRDDVLVYTGPGQAVLLAEHNAGICHEFCGYCYQEFIEQQKENTSDKN